MGVAARSLKIATADGGEKLARAECTVNIRYLDISICTARPLRDYSRAYVYVTFILLFL